MQQQGWKEGPSEEARWDGHDEQGLWWLQARWGSAEQQACAYKGGVQARSWCGQGYTVFRQGQGSSACTLLFAEVCGRDTWSAEESIRSVGYGKNAWDE
eukprot:1159018-Pelagomonas_calceolata.AAC.6